MWTGNNSDTERLHTPLLIVVLVFVAGNHATAGRQATNNPIVTHDSNSTVTLQPFTVKDSIQMTRFMEPSEEVDDVRPAHPQFSPSGRKFYVVTETGVLASNIRDYSLLVYDADWENKRPTLAASFKTSSNRPGISQVKWLTDENVAFLGEQPGQAPQVYVVNCITLQLHQLTTEAVGVIGYDATPDLGTVVYSVQWSGDADATAYKDQHGFVVSNEALDGLSSTEWMRPTNVYITYILNAKTGRTTAVKGGPYASPEWFQRFWLSPNGRYAVTVRPAFPIPDNWEEYKGRWLHGAIHSLRISKQSQLIYHWVGEVMLIDVENATITTLVNAPARGAVTALWQDDSRSVLVAGSYMPIDNSNLDKVANGNASPVLAQFDLSNRSFTRIADIPSGQGWSLQQYGNRVIVDRSQEAPEKLPELVFRHRGNEWVQSSEPEQALSALPNITVRQAVERRPMLVEVDPSTKKERVILDPNPQLTQHRFGDVETIHWADKNGEPWAASLVYPATYEKGTRYPLVIQTHGFSPTRFLTDGAFTTAMGAQELANHDIMVLQLGEGPLEDVTKSTPAEGASNLSSFESAIDYLDRRGLIDRRRVGLAGFSRTCYSVKYALARSRYPFAAAIVAEGFDFSYWQYIAIGADFPQAKADFLRMYGGPPWHGKWKSWMENSITFNFEKVHTPLRVEADSISGLLYMQWETYVALQLLNKPVELVFIPHGAHPLVKPWERLTSQQGMVDWFVFWLKNEEDPAPEKKEQYSRWRELRKLQKQNEDN